MKPNTPLRWFTLVVIVGAVATTALAAPKQGATVYSKRNEMKLLIEPKPLAATAATAGFAEALKVSEIRGTWLNVTGTHGSGWVFAGLIAEEKPNAEKTAGVASVDASSTTTAAAARPLSPEAEQYAQRHNKADAGKDVDWVEAEAHKVAPPIVNAYMKENKKGEYQE